MPLAEIKQALTRSERERRELIERHLQYLGEVVHGTHVVAQTMGFEPIPKTTAVSITTLEALDLSQALDQVLFAAGSDPERPHFMIVLLEGKNGSFRTVATDSYRLAVRDLSPSRLDSEFSVVVPAASVAKWRESLRRPGSVTLHISDSDITAKGEGIRLGARTVPIAFPDYEKFLQPVEPVTRSLVDQAEFLASLESFGDGFPLRITAFPDRLRLVGRDHHLEVQALSEGPEQQVAVNPVFAAEAARGAVGAQIVFEIQDPLQAVIFRSADDRTYTSLVMPVRVGPDETGCGHGR